MSTANIFRKGISTLLNSAIVEVLAGVTGTEKPVELLKENLTFTANEMAQAFQTSYSYACCAVSTGLESPENQQGFWHSLFQANVNRELAARIEQDYVQAFAQQHGLSAAELPTFRETAARQCQTLAKLTIFQAENVPFSEAELASFVTTTGASSLTKLVLELVQTQQALDERVKAFLQFEELLGNALLFFLHEQLRKDKRFNDTLAALQREGLMVDIREIKTIVLATEAKLNQAVAAKTFGDVTQLGQQLERLQQIESVAQTHYASFLEFSQRFADWAQLINVQLEQVLVATEQMQGQLGGIKTDTETIIELLEQLMERANLSPQIKPRDELTQHSTANLALIKQAQQLLKRIPSSDPQYSQMALELGSIVASQGNVTQAEALSLKAYQRARNDEQRALAAFNLFQVFIRQQVYDKAFSSLQKAIQLNSQQYALHNVHTYRIQRILGAGGMGCAFLAQHRLKKELVVIKSFWETLPGSADALFKEAFLMAEIAGDYVPQPLDCGFVDLTKQQRGYFISEYIEGAIDGETWLAKSGKLEVQTGIAVGLQIAKGLQLAHDKGIFHLDLKPANILLKREKNKTSDILKISDVSMKSDISVKIIDFGLAKVAPSLGQEMATQLSRSGLSLLAQAAVFGTMDYAPPEQQGLTSCGEPSAKSDVYALGKTLYRLLTGESPQTLDPRCLAEAPELFYVLCDCVKVEPDRRLDVATVIKELLKAYYSDGNITDDELRLLPSPSNVIQLDEPVFWSYVKKSLSLNFHEKKKIIESIPTLSQFQVDELVKVFQAEKEKFVQLSEEHPKYVEELQAKSIKEWELLKQIRVAENTNQVEAPLQEEKSSQATSEKSVLPPVEKTIQAEVPPLIQVDNRTWWNQLDESWKKVFRKAIGIEAEPSESELVLSKAYYDVTDDEFRLLPSPSHAVQFDERVFLTYLKGSLSLNLREKKRIIESIPMLSQFQVDELVKVFQAEKEKFVQLSQEHPKDIEELQAKSIKEWKLLKQILPTENTTQQA